MLWVIFHTFEWTWYKWGDKNDKPPYVDGVTQLIVWCPCS